VYRVRERVSPAALGLTEQSARREAARCFRSAIQAARSLGPVPPLAPAEVQKLLEARKKAGLGPKRQ